ncbi:MAG: hypothetical protein KDB14_21545 [Planctomycetales bacterium]|nr:hypothetical protein [Planctomycetales bacterium]
MTSPRDIDADRLFQWWTSAGIARLGATPGLLADVEGQLERLGVPPHLAMLLCHRDAGEPAPRASQGSPAMEARPIARASQGSPAMEARPIARASSSKPLDDLLDSLASLPFHSLCRGLILPLMMLDPTRVAQWFGIAGHRRLTATERMDLAGRFLGKAVGLTLTEKVGCLFCDPYLGVAPKLRQDMLLRLLMGSRLAGRTALLERLAVVKDVAVLFAESCTRRRSDPPLTAAEVIRTIRLSRTERIGRRLRVLRSLLERCGRVEAFVLAKLLLGKHGPGLAVPLPQIEQALAAHLGVPVAPVRHAVALTDIYRVAGILEREGLEGLRAIRLQPLSPVRPALANGTVDQQVEFPTWVERKYDGVRFLLHKSTDQRGAVLCGAYTRNGNDWLELVPGLDASIRMIPAHSLILDCELYGMLPAAGGMRPATVYEVIATLRGDRAPLLLRLAAFDVLYLNGEDTTRRPLRDRQLLVSNLCAALAHRPGPVPIAMAEGQEAYNAADINRLYHHFRSQGYEGVITKSLDGAYVLGGRDPRWLKRKPEETLDVVLLGATFSASDRHRGAFGSYVLGALNDGGGYDDIGDVDGVDIERDARIQELILRDSLMTGRQIERRLTEGSRIGVELRPGIVVTVVFQEVTRESDGAMQLRHPRIKVIRSDKSPHEVDTVESIEDYYRAQQLQ